MAASGVFSLTEISLTEISLTEISLIETRSASDGSLSDVSSSLSESRAPTGRLGQRSRAPAAPRGQ